MATGKLKWSDLSPAEKKEAKLKWSELAPIEKQEAKMKFSELSPIERQEAKMKFSELSVYEKKEAKMKFSELSPIEKQEAKMKFSELSSIEKQEAKIKFSELSLTEKQEVKMKFSELSSIEKQEAKMKFSELSLAERQEIKGEKGDPGDTIVVIKKVTSSPVVYIDDTASVWEIENSYDTGISLPNLSTCIGRKYTIINNRDKELFVPTTLFFNCEVVDKIPAFSTFEILASEEKWVVLNTTKNSVLDRIQKITAEGRLRINGSVNILNLIARTEIEFPEAHELKLFKVTLLNTSSFESRLYGDIKNMRNDFINRIEANSSMEIFSDGEQWLQIR